MTVSPPANGNSAQLSAAMLGAACAQLGEQRGGRRVSEASWRTVYNGP
jgi:hypothetical protein